MSTRGESVNKPESNSPVGNSFWFYNLILFKAIGERTATTATGIVIVSPDSADRPEIGATSTAILNPASSNNTPQTRSNSQQYSPNSINRQGEKKLAYISLYIGKDNPSDQRLSLTVL